MSSPDLGAAGRADLVAALRRLRELINSPGNDFGWSSWIGPDDASIDIDALIAEVCDGEVPTMRVAFVFAPTGPAHEVAASSGWDAEFAELARHGERALAAIEHARVSRVARHARFLCSLCGAAAGDIEIDTVEGPGTVVRHSFTRPVRLMLAAPGAGRLRTALGDRDSATVFALDPELAPWFCPMCRQDYCAAHWERWDVFDGDSDRSHDSIRGRCPQGHERMLEG
ncbi:hypothetical protein FOS14_20775 [Skermania sp. ID1734]|uniref:hypothetical protein n=1 Tax=Skermania sp. ID1734 TaxID=2597516 RepID=UPI00117D20D5|nr:hypothetical protein [Skermania sp. ID1734]TSD94453.1 hypothetical protein FOS14_20775 [Skermania sp. ID1734]